MYRKETRESPGEKDLFGSQMSGLVGRSRGLGVLGLVGFSRQSFPLFAHPEVPLQDMTGCESLAASVADPVLDIIMRLEVV